MSELVCLTIRQPYAWAILGGWKVTENRTWATSYRGTLGIHASARPESRTVAAELFNRARVRIPSAAELTHGALLGTVELVDIVPLREYRRRALSDGAAAFATGPLCWILRSPRPLPRPIPMSGRLGLFRVSAALLPPDFRRGAPAVRRLRK